MTTASLWVLIERDQRERLEGEAVARGVSVSALVRGAIDLAFPAKGGRRTAADLVLRAEPMPVPNVDELLAELGRVRGRGGRG